jgi:SAM-dependent methyltransferase
MTTDISYIQRLEPYDRFTLPIQRQIVDWLAFAPGTRVLDAGCGPGCFALLMAEAGCQVDAVDADQGEVDKARQLLESTPYAAQVTCQQADLHTLPFEDGTFDVVWCSRVIHHVPDYVTAARELRRVLKPGGRLVLREGGLPLRMLPFDLGIGEPGLQDRLRIADSRWFAAMQRDTLGKLPYPHGWLKVLKEVELEQITARTFVMDELPPFTPDTADLLLRFLKRPIERDEYGQFLSPDDVQLVNQLADPASPRYFLKRDDIHAQMGDSVYAGYKPLS